MEKPSKHKPEALVVARIAQFLLALLSNRPYYHGSVRLNFHNGSCVNANISESVKLPEAPK